MPVSIVKELKVVQVYDDQRNPLAGALRPVGFFFQFFVKRPMVQKSGQRVPVRLFLRFCQQKFFVNQQFLFRFEFGGMTRRRCNQPGHELKRMLVHRTERIQFRRRHFQHADDDPVVMQGDDYDGADPHPPERFEIHPRISLGIVAAQSLPGADTFAGQSDGTVNTGPEKRLRPPAGCPVDQVFAFDPLQNRAGRPGQALCPGDNQLHDRGQVPFRGCNVVLGRDNRREPLAVEPQGVFGPLALGHFGFKISDPPVHQHGQPPFFALEGFFRL